VEAVAAWRQCDRRFMIRARLSVMNCSITYAADHLWQGVEQGHADVAGLVRHEALARIAFLSHFV
jgi:hypothetical protein